MKIKISYNKISSTFNNESVINKQNKIFLIYNQRQITENIFFLTKNQTNLQIKKKWD